MYGLIVVTCIIGAYIDQTLGMTSTTGSPPADPITPAPATYSTDGLKYDYGHALSLSILFYDAQRTGKLPANNPIPWRGDSLLYEKGANGEDLSGGWFDAGDHVKFNFPMAFTVWSLNWGFMRFQEAYESAGLTNMMCDMIKWPLDYFLKCWEPDSMTLYTQLGDADLDHTAWTSPENWDLPRPAWQVNTSCPGSDVGSDMTSAFATGYLVFRDICNASDYADTLLEAAMSLYNFSNSYRGSYSDCYPNAKNYYGSDNWHDELTAASAWMYKLTGDDMYLQTAVEVRGDYIPDGMDWGSKGAGANLLLYELTGDTLYREAVEGFLKWRFPGGQEPYTPCGMNYLGMWGSARSAANVAYMALAAADDGILVNDSMEYALSQINYLLGDNNFNMSYQVGFGDNYPVNYHHRGSSCVQEVFACIIDDPAPNPNILYGALVGGPGENDEWADDRTDYVRNEVALDYNAGFHSSVAGLLYFSNKGELPASPPAKC